MLSKVQLAGVTAYQIKVASVGTAQRFRPVRKISEKLLRTSRRKNIDAKQKMSRQKKMLQAWPKKNHSEKTGKETAQATRQAFTKSASINSVFPLEAMLFSILFSCASPIISR